MKFLLGRIAVAAVLIVLGLFLSLGLRSRRGSRMHRLRIALLGLLVGLGSAGGFTGCDEGGTTGDAETTGTDAQRWADSLCYIGDYGAATGDSDPFASDPAGTPEDPP